MQVAGAENRAELAGDLVQVVEGVRTGQGGGGVETGKGQHAHLLDGLASTQGAHLGAHVVPGEVAVHFGAAVVKSSCRAGNEVQVRIKCDRHIVACCKFKEKVAAA